MPKLLLLPGMDGTGDLFDDFISSLPSAFETIAVRYPPEQPLPDPELLRYIRNICPASESFALVAESFSTPIAIRYAATRPPNLKCLVLCAGFVTSPVSRWRRGIALLLALPAFKRAVPECAIRSVLVGPNAPSGLVFRVRQAVASVPAGVLRSRLRQILACDVRKELAQLTVPLLYIQARNDRLVAESSLAEIKSIRPDTSVVVLDAPHLLLQVKPSEAARAIQDFVRRHTC